MTCEKEISSHKLALAGKTDVGLVRKNNEDAFILRNIWDGKYSLAVVIDGIGGYEGGEVAAGIAEREINDYLDEFRSGNPGKLLAEAVNSANNAILEEKNNSPLLSRMGCVLTAALSDGDNLYTAHVGDTRLYLERKGRLTKLTHDHSLVGYREEIGDLSEEEAMNHPMRNIINRDLGECLHNSDDEDWIETSCVPLRPGDIILLCSDGLSDVVSSKEILEILLEGKGPAKKVVDLVGKALSKGGKDNVTVVLMERATENEVNNVTVEDVRAETSIKQRVIFILSVAATIAAACFLLKFLQII